MMPSADPVPPYDVSALQAGLHTIALGRVIQCHASLDSTNSAALAAAREGAPHGTVILADAQHAGRGRHGRTWHSPPGHHVYCSVILRLDPSRTAALTLIPLLTALAVAEGIEEAAGVSGLLKWPNDVLVREKKLAGILCESFGGQPDTVVAVGIGINVNARPDDFPPPLNDTVATLLAERGALVDRGRLVTAVLNRLDDLLARLAPEQTVDLISAYTRRCRTLGRPVRAILASHESIEGVAESIGPDGCLRIRLPSPAGAAQQTACIEVRSAEILHLRGVTETGSMR